MGADATGSGNIDERSGNHDTLHNVPREHEDNEEDPTLSKEAAFLRAAEDTDGGEGSMLFPEFVEALTRLCLARYGPLDPRAPAAVSSAGAKGATGGSRGMRGTGGRTPGATGGMGSRSTATSSGRVESSKVRRVVVFLMSIVSARLKMNRCLRGGGGGHGRRRRGGYCSVKYMSMQGVVRSLYSKLRDGVP